MSETEVDEEWLFDISKKVAALTKKVFALHAEAVGRKDEVKRLHDHLERLGRDDAGEGDVLEVEDGV